MLRTIGECIEDCGNVGDHEYVDVVSYSHIDVMVLCFPPILYCFEM